MTIVRAPRMQRDFTILSNSVCLDARLSMRALGLLVRLLSRPDNWRTNSELLAREFDCGRDQMRAVLHELVECGYMALSKFQDERGRWASVWRVYDEPQATTDAVPAGSNEARNEGATAPAPENPYVGAPAPENPYLGSSGPITRTDYQELKYIPPYPLAGGAKGSQSVVGAKGSEGARRRAAGRPVSAVGADGGSKAETMAQYLARCREAGEKALPATHAVWRWAESAGVPDAFVVLAWREFKRVHEGKQKRQKDWPATFSNYVSRGWLGLWRAKDGKVVLSSQGEIAQRFFDAVDRAEAAG